MTRGSPVVVLGAGLAGMSAALHLEAPCRLLERAARVGGLCVTDEDSGYRFDRTGHLLHLRDAEMRAWVQALLGEELRRIERRSRIWSCGRYTRYPFQANTFGLPPDVARECLLGFLQARDVERDAGREPGGAGLRPPRDFEDFILRYMGEGIARHFMIPYNTKLWGVRPRDMSPEWTSRFVPRPTLEEVVAGAVGCNDREIGYNAEFVYPRAGIGALADALGRALGARVELGLEPRRIDLRARRIELASGEDVRYERLISTIPLDTLLALAGDLPAGVSARAGALRCAPLWYLDVALSRRPKVDIHWAYVPEERYPFYRVGAYSNFSDALAPPGCGSLYVELASREPPDLPTLVPEVAAGLAEMGIIDDAGDIAFVRARHLRHAYVVYDHAYRAALDAIHPFLLEQGVRSCGRYGAWEYSAMEDALLEGRAAARAVEEEL
jgi:protoporphyrinogen oxidase